MKKFSFTLLIMSMLAGSVLIWACQKGISWGDETTTTATTAVTAGTGYNWSASLNDTAFDGCIDTAYYQATGAAKTLFIQFTDSAGANIVLGLIAPSGSFAAGTYGSATGNGTIIVTDAAGNSYTVTGAGYSFSFTASTINDTIVEGSFSATVASQAGKVLKVANGKIRALIGKFNPCNSTAGAVTDSSAVFTLVKGSDGKCATVNVKGTYTSGTAVSSSNQAQVDINVTKTGKYNVTTVTTNGLTFSASGTFTATGSQTLTLQAAGTPVTSGATTIPITAGSSNCNFTVTVL